MSGSGEEGRQAPPCWDLANASKKMIENLKLKAAILLLL